MTDTIERRPALQILNDYISRIEAAETAGARRDIFTAMERDNNLLSALADEDDDAVAPFLDRLRSGRLRLLGRSRAFAENINRARADLRRNRAAERFNRAVANEVRLSDIFADLPEGMGSLIIPQGYAATPAGIGKVRQNREGEPETVIVARQPIFITGQGCDIADNTMSVTLTWLAPGGRGWASKTVGRDVICDSRQLTELSIYGAPATSANAKEIVQYLNAFEATNAAVLPTINATKHLGWQLFRGRYLFMLADLLIQPDDGTDEGLTLYPPPGFRHVAEGWKASGTPDSQDAEWDAWCETWNEGSAHPTVALMVYASVASILLEPLASLPGEKPTGYIVDVANETSTGKTTGLRLAASVWGDPDESGGIITKWSTTVVGVERLAGFIKHLPLFLDESKVANEKIVSSVLYSLCNGRGKTRGKPGGDIRETATWRLTTLSTGERPLTTFNGDGGVLGRTISLTGAPLRGSLAECTNAASVINAGAVTHYGQLGRKVATYLVRHRDSWPALKAEWLDTKSRYGALAKGNVGGRIAGYVALITLAKKISEALGLPKPSMDPIETMIASMRANAFVNNRPAEAFHVLYSNCIQHSHKFAGTPEFEFNREKGATEIWGRWETADDSWDGLYILLPVAGRILRSHGVNIDEVLDSWKTRGWLITNKGKNTKQVRLRGRGGSVRTVCFSKETIKNLTAIHLTPTADLPITEVEVPTLGNTVHRPPGEVSDVK